MDIKKEDILGIEEYFKKYQPRSEKLRRIQLIKRYYELKSIRAEKGEEGTKIKKAWENYIKEFKNK